MAATVVTSNWCILMQDAERRSVARTWIGWAGGQSSWSSGSAACSRLDRPMDAGRLPMRHSGAHPLLGPRMLSQSLTHGWCRDLIIASAATAVCVLDPWA